MFTIAAKRCRHVTVRYVTSPFARAQTLAHLQIIFVIRRPMFGIMLHQGGGGRGDPPASVMNANLCSKTNEIYTRYMNFQGFFMPKNAFASL